MRYTPLTQFRPKKTDIILSLTRSARVGYLRDIRRLTVALSRARLGLYILGRRAVFESCYELREPFRLLLRREDKLLLTTGEVYPTGRKLGDESIPATEMVGVEHLGQYVFEIAGAKFEALRRGEGGGSEVMMLEDGAGEGEMSGVEEEGGGEEEDGNVDEDIWDEGGGGKEGGDALEEELPER